MRGENFKFDKPIADPYRFNLSAKELAWMDNCLVGQIKGMYDASFVEQIEDDTSQKNRFDSARILTGVRCLSDIPAGVSIFINGVSYFIKISTSSYEDERSWIDADQPKSHLEEQKADESDEEASCRFEDFNTRINVETAGYSPKTEENVNGRHVSADGHQRAINGEKVAVPPTKGQSNVSPHESDKLVEVPIVSASVSAKASSGSTGSISPVLDEKTGLFIIRIKKALGKLKKKASVRRLIKSSKARVVFIQETKLRTCEDKLIRSLCGSSSSYKFAYSPSVGSAGGLITLWDPAFFTLETSTIEQRFISITGMIHTFNLKCMLINIYAPNDFHCRQELFGSISSLAASSNLPILLGGDFNIVRNAEEKVGMVTQRGAMKAFSDFIDDLSLIDLPLHGEKFTWSNLRDIPSTSRIDRYLLSHKIDIAWPSLIQQVLPRGISDHNPISLSISAAQWGPKPYKWFDHWAENQEFSKIIRASCGVSKGEGIMSVLLKCKSISKDWVADNQNKDHDSIQAIERKCNEIEIEIANGAKVLDCDIKCLKPDSANKIEKPFSSEEICYVVGDGKRIQFWSDIWVGESALMRSFPRIFALACQKRGTIADFGRVVDGIWIWNIQLRQNLFDWEIDVWESFLGTIRNFSSNNSLPDCIRWRANSNGLFTVKSCCKISELGITTPDAVWSSIWSLLAPPSVEAFLWKAVHGRLPTKCKLDFMAKMVCDLGCVSNSARFYPRIPKSLVSLFAYRSQW
ncbi:hypothetical protein V6N13_054304 [Hibiscus sabdariffa]